MSDFSHLDPDAIEMMKLPPGERVPAAWEKMWLGYPAAERIHANLEALLRLPKMTRPRARLIWGTTNNGKTMLVEEFVRMHPPVDDPNEEFAQIPVILIIAPPGGNEKELWIRLLTAMGCNTFRPTEAIPQLRSQASALIEACGVRLIIIDEIHNIYGRRDRPRHFLTVMRDISNVYKVPMVAVGTEEARVALLSDIQTRTRFTPLLLPNWKYDDTFRRMLASFERRIPLPEPSRLSSTALATKIFALSSGLLGEVSEILYGATEYAILNSRARIDPAVIDAIDFKTLAQRREIYEETLISPV